MAKISYTTWLREINSILLRAADIGTWQLVEEETRKPFPMKSYYRAGHGHRAVANMLLDAIAAGAAREVKWRRRRRRT